MTIHLIRHAQSHNNSVDLLQRVCDPPLTDLGHAQAACVARYLKAANASAAARGEEPLPFGFRRLYCSPMQRALDTAQTVADEVDVPVEVWPDLHEIYGIWLDARDGKGPVGYPGLSRSAILAEFPQFIVPEEISESGWWNRPVETEPQWRERALRVARRLREELIPSGQEIALVVHAGFVVELLHAFLYGTTPTNVHFTHGNTALTRLDVLDGRIRVDYMNRIDHLPEELSA